MKRTIRDFAIRIFKSKSYLEMTKSELELIYKLVKRRDKVFLDAIFDVSYDETNIETLLEVLSFRLRRV